jgi:N-acetylmuramoyl-L-alanine amidase
MKIINHQLASENAAEKIITMQSGNAGELIDPDYVIIHYTATDSARSAVDLFMNTTTNVNRIAAHIVLDSDGTIIQLIPFNRKANHAGPSTWDNVDFLNSHAIGIELVNFGYVEKLTNGSFRRLAGKDKKGNPVFTTFASTESTRIIKADHKHKFWSGRENKNWFIYPEAQLKALFKLCKVLFENYQMVTAIGHDDISPGRKLDPGPAFPWDNFKMNVFGNTNNTGKTFIVNQPDTNLRASFTTNSISLKKLPVGYEVGLIETNGQWSKVYLVDKLQEVLVKNGKNQRCVKTIGWIFSSLLTEKAGQ